MFEIILVPTDGSDLANKAAETAIDLAKSLNASVIALHVIDQQLIQPYEILEEQGKKFLNRIKDIADEKKVECRKELIYGHPKNDIKTIAIKSGADLIVMGTKGETGLTGTVMGSLAQRTLRTVNLPIMFIK
jgi:nucleotide-binding universal stress UspA family protein